MPRVRTLEHEPVPQRPRGYESDFVGWAEDTARAIAEGRWNAVDREVVADEIAALARSDKRVLRSALELLLLHLLKQRYQPERASRSWEQSIFNARKLISQLIEESPSLRPMLNPEGGDFRKAYADARQLASFETGLPIGSFPESLSFDTDEIWGENAAPEEKIS